MAEAFSNHPISRSLKEAYGKPIDTSLVSDVEEISGYGVKADVAGKLVQVGNEKLMNSIGIQVKEVIEPGTVIHVAIEGKYHGYILISDMLKEHSKEAIVGLKKAGIKKTVMLTGDSKKVADLVAADLGLDEVCAELLPGDKVSKVEDLLETKSESEQLYL